VEDGDNSLAFHTLKPVIEGDAVALAAVLAQKVPLAGKTTAVILSGGNADPEMFAEIIQSTRPSTHI
jgi:threonine dehydratase